MRETLPCCVGMIWSLQQREFVSIMPSGDHEVTQCAMLVHLYPFLPAVKINSVTFLWFLIHFEHLTCASIHGYLMQSLPGKPMLWIFHHIHCKNTSTCHEWHRNTMVGCVSKPRSSVLNGVRKISPKTHHLGIEEIVSHLQPVKKSAIHKPGHTPMLYLC